MITTVLPFMGMMNHSSPNHIQINIDHTAKQMGVGIHCCSVIAILPESPIALFALVIILSRASCYELQRSGNNFTISLSIDE
jgi:hypothetical protein